MLVRLGRRRRRHRVAVDASVPRVIGVGRGVAERAPDVAAGLEAGPERQHPEAVAGLDTALGLEVGELVEHEAAGGVAEAANAFVPSRIQLTADSPKAAITFFTFCIFVPAFRICITFLSHHK